MGAIYSPEVLIHIYTYKTARFLNLEEFITLSVLYKEDIRF